MLTRKRVVSQDAADQLANLLVGPILDRISANFRPGTTFPSEKMQARFPSRLSLADVERVAMEIAEEKNTLERMKGRRERGNTAYQNGCNQPVTPVGERDKHRLLQEAVKAYTEAILVRPSLLLLFFITLEPRVE